VSDPLKYMFLISITKRADISMPAYLSVPINAEICESIRGRKT